MAKSPNVAVLGMGAMGSRMALALLDGGFAVTVWNRDPARAAPVVARGASAAETPALAVAEADIVIAMLRDDEASRSVWCAPGDGALAGMKRGAVAIESSTLTTGWAVEVASRAAAAGVTFLDAPVAGSRPQADARQLIHFVGGDADVLERARPVLAAIGGAIHHVGPAGSGATVKLAVNALLAVQVAAMAEFCGFLQGNGVDLAKAVEVIGATPVASPSLKGAAGAMLARNFAPMFPIELAEKDLGYAIATGIASGHELPVTDAARGVLAAAMAEGFGGQHLSGIVQLYG